MSERIHYVHIQPSIGKDLHIITCYVQLYHKEDFFLQMVNWDAILVILSFTKEFCT